MKILLLAVGRIKSAPVRELCADYLARLQRYGSADVTEVKASENADPARRIAEESARLLEQLTPADQVVVLDERGRPMTSPELSKFIKDLELRGTRRLVLLLGGAYGVGDNVRARGAPLSLSKMTLPHELCRALALEQLYRARTIQHGEPYHHA